MMLQEGQVNEVEVEMQAWKLASAMLSYLSVVSSAVM
jgi:hypothetical protein